MNKEEAIEAMKNGKKITHKYFDKDEWMSIHDNMIVLEDGYSCTLEDFWCYRTSPGWEDDYRIFLENEKKWRNDIYKQILHFFLSDINRGLITFGFCKYLNKLELGISQFPELLERKPKKDFYYWNGLPTKDNSQFWFPIEDNKIRIQILEEVILETTEE